MPQEFRIQFDCAPGDIVASTALIRDLKLTYKDKIKLTYDTNQPEILIANPYLEPVSSGAKCVRLDYSEGLRRSQAGEHIHFVRWFHTFWEQQTGMSVWLHRPFPDLHLPEKLKETPPISGKYWLVFAGGKKDCTLKHWDFAWYDRVVSSLRHYFKIWCVQTGATGDDHVHPPLKSVALNLVGWGGLLEMMWQIYHCQGVICPITCAMHMAAAFNKPCVVIAGGREEPWWEAYNRDYNQFGEETVHTEDIVEHKFLHTLGLLPCCEQAGCGRIHLPRPGVDPSKACVELATRKPGQQQLPMCLGLIEPAAIVGSVDRYITQLKLKTGGRAPTLLATDVPFRRKS